MRRGFVFALVATVVRGQLSGPREHLVQPELVAQPDRQAHRRAGHVADQPAHHLLDLRLVNGHVRASSLRG